MTTDNMLYMLIKAEMYRMKDDKQFREYKDSINTKRYYTPAPDAALPITPKKNRKGVGKTMLGGWIIVTHPEAAQSEEKLLKLMMRDIADATRGDLEIGTPPDLNLETVSIKLLWQALDKTKKLPCLKKETERWLRWELNADMQNVDDDSKLALTIQESWEAIENPYLSLDFICSKYLAPLHGYRYLS